MLQKMTPSKADVELAFVRDSDMADLNQRFMDCQGPTNCLAFPSAGHGGGLPGGGLCISLDALYRESLFYDQADDLYLRRLLAHGLAHLAGHDHGAEMEDLCAALEKCR
jgi:probable rRNA maturation factor